MSFLLLYPSFVNLYSIPCIPTLILRIPLILFPNSPFRLLHITCPICNLYNLFQEIITLVQKRTLPCLRLYNLQQQIIVYIIYDVISDITKYYLRYSA